MTAWSRSEATRTIEEVKRRAIVDPEFRALALSDPIAAVTKVNPRPVPVGSVRFVEAGEIAEEISSPEMIVAILPVPSTFAKELTEEDLEEVAGGGSAPAPPPVTLS